MTNQNHELMVVNVEGEVTAGNGKQYETTLSPQPSSNEPKEQDSVSESYEISDDKKSVITPQCSIWKINDNLEIKNKRKSEIPHNLDLPPTPTFAPSSYCDNNSPTSSPCFSSYFDIYQTTFDTSISCSEGNLPTDSPDTPPLSPPGSPLIVESSCSPKSPDSVLNSPSLPLLPLLSNLEQRHVENRPRRVSFNKTVTFIPHIPPPPNKIRKKLTREASLRQKDLVVKVEDLGKVRLDGKNGRVIKIVPNVFPGPLNGEYGQCGVMLKDVDVSMEISSPNTSKNYKKLRLGKHFKRYYNKLVQ
ncbi:14010_t:CDS:2 [Funneliformis mosseae]|uniref:14010_t:CDS:1 n=1 Tax=Funneliformis mosseae TaxID=27381 RepID=A0A9N8YMP0_FUNMO|nr:14010_t:CDS:2 [Funneliformis mosseae]